MLRTLTTGQFRPRPLVTLDHFFLANSDLFLSKQLDTLDTRNLITCGYCCYGQLSPWSPALDSLAQDNSAMDSPALSISPLDKSAMITWHQPLANMAWTIRFVQIAPWKLDLRQLGARHFCPMNVQNMDNPPMDNSILDNSALFKYFFICIVYRPGP